MGTKLINLCWSVSRFDWLSLPEYKHQERTKETMRYSHKRYKKKVQMTHRKCFNNRRTTTLLRLICLLSSHTHTKCIRWTKTFARCYVRTFPLTERVPTDSHHGKLCSYCTNDFLLFGNALSVVSNDVCSWKFMLNDIICRIGNINDESTSTVRSF